MTLKTVASGNYTLFVISALIAVGPFSMEAYLPAVPTIAKELGVSVVDVNYSISTYLFGAALGQLVGGPVSDQIGRRNNVIIGLLVFCAASIGVAFSHDIETIQLLRFFQALGGGFASVVGLPALRDIFDPETTARKMPMVSAVTMIAPLLAPLVGAILMQWSWRAIFIFLAVFATVVLIVFPVTIKARTGQLQSMSVSRVLGQYFKVISHRVDGHYIGLRYIMAQGFSSGIFFTFLTNASWVYIQFFSVSEWVFPFLFAAHMFALMVANLALSRIMGRMDAREVLRMGSMIQIISLVVLAAAVIGFHVSLPVFVALLMAIIAAGAMINIAIRSMVYGYFDFLTGSVTSLLSFARFTFGGILGFATGLLFDGTLLPLVGVMLGSGICCYGVIASLPATTLREVTARGREEGL